MKRVRITGYAVVRLIQFLDVPEDELSELLGDDENLICNVDEDNCQKEIMEWQCIHGEVES